MAKAVKDQVYRLIKSLSKAEKRNFKLYATRAGASTDSKFIRLFAAMEQSPAVDEDRWMARTGLRTRSQLSNLKRHLYQEVLTSLRLIHIGKEIDIELREQIDFTRILYGKGHYLDALRLLERAKAKAVEHSQDLLHLEILEFQKLIEARHITRSRQVSNKMDLLLRESSERSQSVLATSELTNLVIQVQGLYIDHGHTRSYEEGLANNEFWREAMGRVTPKDTARPTFHQRVHQSQATMWFHYIQLNFTEALAAATNAYTLFTLSRQMTVKDPDLYLRCLYYVTMFAYLQGEQATLSRYRRRIETFLADDDVHYNENTHRLGAVYAKLARFNELFTLREYEAAEAFGEQLVAAYGAGDFRPNAFRWGLFRYKAAAAAFLQRNYDRATDHLNEIVNAKAGALQSDLVLNARLLNALCNFELGHNLLVDYQLTNLGRLMRRSPNTAEVHRLAVGALRRLINLPVAEHAPVYARLANDLRAARRVPFEAKALVYLDLQLWVDRKSGH